MFYTINSSQLLATKYVFMLTIDLSSYQLCPVPLNTGGQDNDDEEEKNHVF